jgi:hypothetical protein
MNDRQSLLLMYEQILCVVLILIVHVQRLEMHPTYFYGYVFHIEFIQLSQIFGFVVLVWFTG